MKAQDGDQGGERDEWSDPTRRTPGPWWLKVRGIWGSGRRSLIRVDEVYVVDLGAPADDDDDELCVTSAGVQAALYEDCEPTSGLDVEFARFVIEFPPGGAARIRRHG